MLSMETLGNQGTGMSDDIHVVSRGRLVDYLDLPSRGLHLEWGLHSDWETLFELNTLFESRLIWIKSQFSYPKKHWIMLQIANYYCS